MTKSSKKWRNKRRKQIRGYRKIHNLFLGVITGVMAVFFLLSLCAMEVNKDVILMFLMSTLWLSLFIYVNDFED